MLCVEHVYLILVLGLNGLHMLYVWLISSRKRYESVSISSFIEWQHHIFFLSENPSCHMCVCSLILQFYSYFTQFSIEKYSITNSFVAWIIRWLRREMEILYDTCLKYPILNSFPPSFTQTLRTTAYNMNSN